MPRKNRRKKQGLRFNPDKYIVREGAAADHHGTTTDGGHNARTTSDRHGTTAVRRGEIWYADLGGYDGSSVQRGCRPVIIVSNDAANETSGTVTVLPVTSKLKKTWYPSHVLITDDSVDRSGGKPLVPSVILTEQIRTIDKAAMRNRVGMVGERKLREVESALRMWMGL